MSIISTRQDSWRTISNGRCGDGTNRNRLVSMCRMRIRQGWASSSYRYDIPGTLTIKGISQDVSLIGRLLPPSPATPGSGCPQLYPAATTAGKWTVSHLHPDIQRLVAHSVIRQNISGTVWPSTSVKYSMTRTVTVTPPPLISAR